MTNSILTAMFLVFLGIGSSAAAEDLGLKEIHICDLTVAEPFKQGHMNFPVSFEITLDETGKLRDYRDTTDKDIGISPDEVVACLSRWQFVGAKVGQRVTISFQWMHGLGWTEIRIKSDNLDVKVSLPQQTE